MEKIKIFMVEDDPDWLRGLQDYIGMQDDFFVIGIASTKQDAIDQLSQLEVDVILMDIILSKNKREGVDIALKISKMKDTPIIMLTSLSDEETIIDAFTSGAVNYVNKSNFKDIPEAIRAAYFRRSSIHSSAAESVLSELNRMKREERQSFLTPSEKGILKLIEAGSNQSQVAATIHIAEQTLKNHISKILKKLGVKTSKEAAETARKKGML